MSELTLNNGWLKEEKNDVGFKIILFLLSPFFSFLYSLKRMNTKSSYIVFFLFSLFFGLAFTTESGRQEGGYQGDGAAYRWHFELYNQGILDYQDAIDDYFLNGNGGTKDLYNDTLCYLVSRVTNNYHFFFFAAAFVFALFQLKSFKFFTQDRNYSNGFVFLIMAYLFMYNQIFNINGLRFNTASWVAIYCIFQIFVNKNNYYYLLAAITPLIHVSFWIFVVVLLIAEIFRKTTNLWIVLFYISFVLSFFASSFLQDLSPYLPPILERMVDTYTNDTASTYSIGAFIIRILNIIEFVYINTMVILLIKEKGMISQTNSYRLFQVLLVFMAFFNFLYPVSSLHRFFYMIIPVVIFLWMHNFGINKYTKILYIYPIIAFYSLFSWILKYTAVTDLSFWFSNPISLLIKYLT